MCHIIICHVTNYSLMPKTNLSKPQTPSASPVSLVPDPVTPDLTAIKALKLSGEVRLSVIICKVWGLPSASGRNYQSAREEYRKLTGE